MTYNELAELFKREGGDAQVCFSVISQNQILFGNNDTKKDIISFKNEEPIKWVKEVQEEPVSDECIYNRTLEERQRSCKFCSAACQVRIKEPVSEDTMTIRKDWFEHCKKSWYNEGYIDGKHNRDGQFGEPVSEDLEKASKEWLAPQLDKSYANYGEAKMMELTHFDGYAMLDAIEFGAKWQKSKMVRNAMDGEVKFSDAECRGYRGDFWIESRFLTPYEANEYVGGEKVKLIIIKED